MSVNVIRQAVHAFFIPYDGSNAQEVADAAERVSGMRYLTASNGQLYKSGDAVAPHSIVVLSIFGVTVITEKMFQALA